MQYSLLCIIICCECARLTLYNTCMQGVDITSTWLNGGTRTLSGIYIYIHVVPHTCHMYSRIKMYCCIKFRQAQ